MADRSPGKAAPARDAGLSIGLLGIGLVHVTFAVATLRDAAGLFDENDAQLQLPAYDQPAVASAAGWIASAVLVVALALAIAFAVPRLRAGRRSWWIPVVCAAIGWTVVTVIVASAWLADPAVAQSVLSGATAAPTPS